MGTAVSFLQLTSVIAQFDVELDGTLRNALHYVSYLNLNFVNLPNSAIHIDWRFQATIITTGLPLALILTVLLVYQPFFLVLWYACLLTCLALTAAATVVLSLKDSSVVVSSSAGWVVLIVGVVGTVVCLLLWVIVRLVPCFRGCVTRPALKPNDTVKDLDDRLEEETKEFSWVESLIHILLLAAVCIAAGIVGGIIQISALSGYQSTAMSSLGSFAPFCRVLGIVFFIIAVVLLAYKVIMLFRPVRRFLWKIRNFFSKHFLKMLLVSLNLVYLPVMQNTVAVWNCADVTCAAGTRFPEDDAVYSGLRVDQCMACKWYPSTLNMSVANATGQLNASYCPVLQQWELCPEETRFVLTKNYGVDCNAISWFWWPSSAIIVLAFGVGLLWLFHRLISQSLYRLEAYPLEEEVPNPSSRWLEVLVRTKALTRSLYEPYRHGWRWWRLYEILVKATIVIVTAFFVGRGAQFAGLVLIAALHWANLGIIVMWRPYISYLELFALGFVALMLSVNYLLAILVFKNVIVLANVPWLSIFMVVINIMATVFTIVIMLLFFKFRKRIYAAKARKLAVAEGRVPLLAAEGHDSLRDIPGNAVQPVTDDDMGKAEAQKAWKEKSADLQASQVGDMQLASVSTMSDANGPSGGPGREADGPQAAQSLKIVDDPPEKLVECFSEPQLDATAGSLIGPEAVARRQNAIDFQIKEDTHVTMSRLFMFTGVLVFIALTCCVSGMLYDIYFGNYVPARPYSAAARQQLLLYNSWANFTDNCCCMATPNKVNEESWFCLNGKTVHRLRVEGGDSGLPIRPFCAAAFTPGCAPLVVEGDVVMTCNFTVSGGALADLW
eukprot:EG_transcript_1825